MLALILMIECLAIGLKINHDRQAALKTLEREMQQDVLAVSEFISGQARTILTTLKLTQQAGWSTRQTQQSLENRATVLSVIDALSARTGSDEKLAGDAAALALKAGHSVQLSSNGDLLIIHQPSTRDSRLAILTQDSLFPVLGETDTLSLEAGPEAGSDPGLASDRRACSGLFGGNVQVCLTRQRTGFSWLSAASLLLYVFLLAGPALAIFGLLKLLEAQLLKSRDLDARRQRSLLTLNSVLKEAQAGIWSWNSQEDKLTLSQQAANLLGEITPVEYPLELFLNHVHQDHRQALSLALEQLDETRFISKTFALKDGKSWLEMRASPQDNATLIRGVLLDVSTLREALTRSREAETRLKSALESFSGPFALWDRNQRLVHWNKTFSRIFALQGTIRPGMSHAMMKIAQDSNIIERRQGQDSTEIIQVKQGPWFKILERTTHDGGLITVGLNVTENIVNEKELHTNQQRLKNLVSDLERSEGYAEELARKLNEQKIRAERSANSKSAFLANMSHELRTPLNAINGFSEVLSEELYGPLGDPRYLDYSRDILASGQHLLDMINDILDMAKIEAGKTTIDLRPIDLVEPVDAAIRMIRRRAEEKSIQLNLHAQNDLPHVDADHRAVKQMVLNLLSNAIKFTDENGQINVSVLQHKHQLCVAVQDDGIGIPEDALPHLAQPFEQVADSQERNTKGTGLGLALTKSFAELHGGKLMIASRLGEGTTVSFLIPVNQDKSDSAGLAA